MPPLPLPADERLGQAADAILRAFEDYHQRFRAITRRAKARFARRDWWGIRRDTVERLHYHPQAVDHAITGLRDLLGDHGLADRLLWSRIKDAHGAAILGRDDFELAQTFFNSLTRRLFPHIGLDPAIDYVSADFPLPYRGWEMASARTYAVRRITPELIRRLIHDADLRVQLAESSTTEQDTVEQDTAERAAARAQASLDAFFGGEAIDAIDVLRPVFVRNKGAYLVGRARRGERLQPLVLALVHDADGLQVDAVLQEEDAVSIVFGFTRWYFHAEVDTPRAVIGFLSSILPRKRVGELYVSLGYDKHGKTELYADLLHQVDRRHERFEVAPGQRGLVMAVFMLPGWEFVFKVIKDRFPAQKNVTRELIRERYRMVHRHDRVGRLVDYQEFEDLALPRSRFDEALLDELLDLAGDTVSVDGDRVVIRHLYVGRWAYPLDLYVRQQPAEQAAAAMIDYGRCLAELAAANLFAGDMLLKNFGVTRHGRVVFYDYDELRPLHEMTFRTVPPPRDEVEEMSDQPWFSISSDDVFPEELRHFLGVGGRLREVFEAHHAALYGAEFWRSMQARLHDGEIPDVFPYPREPG